MVNISFFINGKSVSMEVAPHESALQAIRDRLKLKGAKEGCGIGECGACTILVDGAAVNACLMLAPQMDGRSILTIEGVAEDDRLSSLQKTFVERGAIQCGFCSPGALLSAKALLDRNPNPTREEIIGALSGNLCRCTGYEYIIDAVEAAVGSSEETR